MAQPQVQDTLDTNLIVHFLLKDNLLQYRKVKKLLNDPNTGIHRVPTLAISEAVYVLEAHYNRERKTSVFLLQFFLKFFDDILDYNRELFDLVFPYYLQHPGVSFNDCCMAFYTQLNTAEPLLTFDKTLAKQHPSAELL